MKADAILVNASRGPVVDTAALIDALRGGRIAAARARCLRGRAGCSGRVARTANTVLLPHIGSATAATRDAMARLCAENVIAVIDGLSTARSGRLR